MFRPLCLAIACTAVFAENAPAQTVRSDFWTPNWPVSGALITGNTLYIHGDYNFLGPQTGGGALVTSTDGSAIPGFPRVQGSVLIAIPDGVGGWFIGGAIGSVGGQPRSALAHISADRTVTSWSPIVDGYVRALARRGSTLYAGGQFTMVDGQPRAGLAAFATTTGGLLSWNPGVSGGVVNQIVVGDSVGPVFVAGEFTALAGLPRNRIGAVDAVTGALRAWNPNSDGSIMAMSLKSGVVYVGGAFSAVGGLSRAAVAALDTSTGLATGWNPGANDVVSSIHVNGQNVYLGGAFNFVNGSPRARLAAVDVGTGLVTSWNPTGWNYSRVYALSSKAGRLYVGGSFGLAAVDLSSGAIQPWDPKPNGVAYAVTASDSGVLVGGDFTSVGAQPSQKLSALDLITGTATAWEPAPSALVRAMAVRGGTLIVGGDFAPPPFGSSPSIGGQQRYYIAALDLATALATPWAPILDGNVNAIAVHGATVYVSGNFTQVGGQLRDGLAALDAVTGTVLPFAPASDGTTRILGVRGNTVYVAGDFTTIGGQPRNHFATLDGTTGLATAWDPRLTGEVYALASGGSKVYVGGNFTSIGGAPRNHLAALDTSTANATPWDPGADGTVRALTLDGPWVYVGGSFSTINGQPRRLAAAVEASSGLVVGAWHPELQGNVVQAIAVASPTVCLAGDFLSVNGILQNHLAVLADVSTPTQLALASVVATAEGVRLTWFAADRRTPSANLERRTEATGWHFIARLESDGNGVLQFEDSTVEPGGRYAYRLGTQASVGDAWTETVWVDVPGLLGFSLGILGGNPSPNALRVRLSLPNDSPAQVDLLDVTGRRLERVPMSGTGVHVLDLAAGHRFPVGLYLIRLTQGSERRTLRAVLTR
ncbi:MAG: hypothetical protein ABIU54_10820 [Candidatus Eisenbacteria bacterium]